MHVGEFLSFGTQNCAMGVVYKRVHEGGRRTRTASKLYFSMSEEIIDISHDNPLNTLEGKQCHFVELLFTVSIDIETKQNCQ